MRLHLRELPIYVAHYRKLAERRRRLEQDMATYGLGPSWLTSHDPEDLSAEFVARHCDSRDETWRKKTEFYTRVPPRRLKSSELSLALKHLDFYRRVASGCSEHALVLEDDAILSPAFDERFNHYFADTPDDFDMVFVGSGCNLRVPNPSRDKYFYEKGTPATKCTDSYLITRRAAHSLLSTLPPFTLPIDFELNYQIHAHRLKVYWLEPPLVTQGSQCGVYASAIQNG